MKFKKYQKNVKQQGKYIYSNNMLVATVEGTELHQNGYFGFNAQKHIDYVANELNLKLIRSWAQNRKVADWVYRGPQMKDEKIRIGKT